MIKVKELRLTRARRLILQIPRLEIESGELVAILGPNGAGKSSLLQALGLLIPASFQDYRFAGQVVRLPTDSLTIRRQIGVVFQEPLLLDTSVIANAASGLQLRGIGRIEARERALHYLKRLGVDDLKERSARQLSGGEAQRVSLARALALRPKLLLLDEPFAALDVFTRSTLLRDLRPLLRESDTTTLLVTHDVTEVAYLADRVIVLEDGRVAQEGGPAQIFAAPQTSMVQRMAEMASEMAVVLAQLKVRPVLDANKGAETP